MKAMLKSDVMPNDIVNKTQVNANSQNQRKQEIFKIKILLKQGYETEFYSKNNWFRLGGKTFNGYTKEQVEKMQKEVCDYDDEQI